MKFGLDWTTSEVDTLRRLASQGAAVVADALGRSVPSVRSEAQRQGISLRRTGVRRGRLLGIPNGAHDLFEAARLTVWYRQVREWLLTEEMDIAIVRRRFVLLKRGTPLCPSCAMRPVETTEGLCAACQLRLFREAIEITLETKQAQRDNDRERQAKRERVTCPHCGNRVGTA